jgi:flagellar hook-basal body complex protein FliE
MTELNTLQTQADQATQDFAAGKDIPLHQVMIAMNKADMSMQLAMQVRNKVLGAYQEISRMPV